MATTSSTIPLLLRMVHDSTKIVITAGRIVRNILKTGNLDIVDKGVNDLQTKADRVAQQYIIDNLSTKYPKLVIIGEEPETGTRELIHDEWLEEENHDDPTTTTTTKQQQQQDEEFNEILSQKVPLTLSSIREEEFVIWVDPLDGTGEFTQGLLEHVTILIGIAFNGHPVGGVMHQPFVSNHPTMWGIPGVGYGGFQLSGRKPSMGKPIITTTLSHSNPCVEAALEVLKPLQVIRVGGAGHKATLLLNGQAHAYVYASPGCKKWDTCAPEAILYASGGQLTDMNGQRYKYDKDVGFVNEGGLLATAPGENHDWYIKQISTTMKSE